MQVRNGTLDRHLDTQHAGVVIKEDAGVVGKAEGALMEESKESEHPQTAQTSLSAPSLPVSFKVSTLNLPLEKRMSSFPLLIF